ncbi:sulfate/molybdate ABC transporter ATP-binding protein [Novosphingobium sp. P6W]|uniref:sulfate/molybdate ABC transporter ATP-binding protein n=1 Tax=Novosphingobium sp. P6W TaxID=1609758 RepID=UPI0005C2F1E7|nr:sulfate/molybdate ABC transporter ATP-binding protein [Novosphingobium sp. P6W]AXB78374.1 sulfate ABC transporter ATP-binding protein [Novosphingobium sp. P6W]KIS32323.1 sulfate ABC transporter ATP-binding protein [Novosphingobium sp. P6W]
MIRVQNVTKTFGDFAALHGIDLEIKPGEFVALLGPSGSGKTTLLRIIAGLEFQDGGEVLFDGEDVSSRSVGERQVGFVFQQYALFKHMTVAENVAFGLSVRRKGRPPKADIRARAEELLRLVQLDGLGKRYPGQLSGGQRQRVALARALAIEPRLLLLDEPFGALDAKVRKDLRRWLRGLHESMGLTSIFVTHDQEEALELADRVVVMDHGRIEQVGTPEQVYMEPASPFVSNFVGETNQLPGGIHVRPHDIELVASGGIPVVVENVFRRGGSWRVEGRIEGHGNVVEFDVDAAEPAPTLGDTVRIQPLREREFHKHAL